MTEPDPDTWWIVLGTWPQAQQWMTAHPEAPHRQVIVLTSTGDECHVMSLEGRIVVAEMPGWRSRFPGESSNVLAMLESRNRTPTRRSTRPLP